MRFIVVAVVVCGLMCSCSRTSGNGNEAAANASAPQLDVLTCVDKPSDGETVSGVLEVTGWALIPEGTRSVTVTLDGSTQFPAQINVPRPDVAQAHPQYKNEKAGWMATIPLRDVNPGPHAISISAVSATGKAIGITSSKVIVR